MRRLQINILGMFAALLWVGFAPAPVLAHCETMDGPVVTAGRKAVESGNAAYALVWVKPEDEDAVRKALKRARDKRRKAKTGRGIRIADMQFFEALVRIHREGEGAPYEGIKPAGTAEPELVLADTVLHTGNPDTVLGKIASQQTREHILHLFDEARSTMHYRPDDVAAGRQHIRAYVRFIHAVESALHGEPVTGGHDHHA